MTIIVIMKEEIIELCGFDEDHQIENLFMDEIYDDCLLGVIGICNNFSPAYNHSEIIKKIINDKKITEEKAIDYFNENVLTKYPELSFIHLIEDKNPKKLSLYNEGMLFMDDLNPALIGIRIKKDCDIISVYDERLCIDFLINSGIGDLEEAVEYFQYNVTGAYVGVNTPGILTLLNDE